MHTRAAKKADRESYEISIGARRWNKKLRKLREAKVRRMTVSQTRYYHDSLPVASHKLAPSPSDGAYVIL